MDTSASHSAVPEGLSRYSVEEESEDSYDTTEKRGLLESYLPRRLTSKRWVSNFWFNVLVLFNVVVGLVLLAVAFTFMLRPKKVCFDGPEPPYSPVREEGYVRYINTRYKPDKVYQSSTLEEVDEIWDSWLRKYDHLVLIPKEKAREGNLPESVESYIDPGYAPYGLAVYHQMHCLNRLRKSFYPEKYFPNESHHMVEFHMNHCVDMIRQSIVCHGDVALLYWWNSNYSYVDEAGTKHYTDEYLQRSPDDRLTGAFAMWDTPVQCRDLDSLNDFVQAHYLDDDKYGGQDLS